MTEREKIEKFKVIYAENFLAIFRFLRSRLPSLHDSEDVTSLVFTELWQKIESIDIQSSYRAWLYQCAKHKLIDFLRKYYKVSIKSISFIEDLDSEAFKYEFYTDSKGDDQNKRKYTHILDLLVDKLTAREKELIKFKYKENQSYTQIAKSMGITVENAKVINNRTIKKLKRLWEAK
jgi:RNA polymerase sigma factor (sigma-70 family)